MARHITKSVEETMRLAQKIAKEVGGATVLGLIGELGAGKTAFVSGLAKGLNVPESCYVSSPTFTILKIYPGDLDIYHFDFYRLTGEDDFESIGFEDYLKEDRLVVIEWADKFMGLLPKNIVKVEFEITAENERRITIGKI